MVQRYDREGQQVSTIFSLEYVDGMEFDREVLTMSKTEYSLDLFCHFSLWMLRQRRSYSSF